MKFSIQKDMNTLNFCWLGTQDDILCYSALSFFQSYYFFLLLKYLLLAYSLPGLENIFKNE